MPASRSRRVVITGMGLISPLGNELSQFWSALAAGQSGVRPITSFPVANLPVRVGGEAVEFTGHIDNFGELEASQTKAIRKGLKVMCREIQMGVAAAQRALQHSGLKHDTIDRERTGIVFGSDYIMTMPEEFEEGVRNCRTSSGELSEALAQWAEQGLPKVTPLWLLKYLPNMPACHVAIYNDLRGPNNSITVREASSNLAIAEAFCTIERGHAEAMIGGATGSRVHPIRTIHVALQEELAERSGDPVTWSRPFDANRSGMVVGEGSAAVMMEEQSFAVRRGATPIAEILGYGSSAVIDRKSIARRDIAMENAMRQALRNAGLSPQQIGHVHAHGLSTIQCDREEAMAISRVFAERTTPVPVVAAKSYVGNIGAGGGAVELIASIQSLQAGRLFRTLNYEHVDAECPIAVVDRDDVPAGDNFLNLSVTPQGQASALIVGLAD